ncbi:hypothetical protein VTK73DRAFT_1023 [Phialemonium thermophilum]|uniref:Uncharacterized protein n=1 Tax=Phialemonium thermophilum TaxID=223376 RepID=A0ABR3V2A5_9PEZI
MENRPLGCAPRTLGRLRPLGIQHPRNAGPAASISKNGWNVPYRHGRRTNQARQRLRCVDPGDQPPTRS